MVKRGKKALNIDTVNVTVRSNKKNTFPCCSIRLVNIFNHGEISFSTAHIIILPLSNISVKNSQLETKRQKTPLFRLLGCNATGKTNRVFRENKTLPQPETINAQNIKDGNDSN